MQETLKAAFGEWGAILAQFLITVVVVLVLIALVYWLVRRYSGIRLGGIGRGRVPRLAVVDAMAIDSRRQLVLVRRDNVEHLILIGGPADLVVEPSIQRPRARPAQQPGAATAAPAAQAPSPQPAAPPPNPLFPPEEIEPQRPQPAARGPIPFPQRSSPIARSTPGNDRITLRPLHRPLAPPPEPLPPPARLEPEQPAWAAAGEAPSAFHPQSAEPQPEEHPPLPEFMAAAAEAEAPPQEWAATEVMATPEPASAEPPAAPALDLGEGGAPAIDPAAEPPPPEEPAGATPNDLEREMARLLGEFGAKRPP